MLPKNMWIRWIRIWIRNTARYKVEVIGNVKYYLCSIHLQDVILACAILHKIAIRWNAKEFAEEEEEEGDAVRDDGYGWEQVEHVLDEEWEAEQHFVPGDAEAGDIARRQLGSQRRETLREAMPQRRYRP
jgi:hypothetical protein